ncbi:MAG: polysaccharide biosynthesis C-terminal domain-containing protein [Bacteroidales bacterium]|nr:polysaccharide biosynthesis C-terminal domain-containing protein [Bacteroidales bacterium]
MSGMKKLAKETAIYGLSSIVGKFLNWGLVPIYTRVLANTGEYGVVTNLYSWTAFLLVMLTYGMETGFFRFANKPEYEAKTVYSTTISSIGITSLLFVILGLFFAPQVSSTLGFGVKPEYITMLVIIVAMDAFSAIPFAYLRYKNRPLRFASIKMIFIFVNIATNLFFLILCPYLHKIHPEWISWFYRPDYGVGYILVANLISTSVMMLGLIPEMIGFRDKIDWQILRQMLKYSLPLLVLGIAGIISQTVDKMLFPFLIPDKANAMAQLGIYGANFKIAVVMVMFTQAFRFAYEPFVFAKNKGENNKKVYADAMKYFVIITLLIFLGIMFYMDFIKYIIDPSYFAGLNVVPIVMLGQLFFGIYFNLSIWYKLIDQTKWGAYFSIIVCTLTVVLNFALVPRFGYIGCAWASLISNFAITLMSYFMGQRKFKINYELSRIFTYFLLTIILYAAYLILDFHSFGLNLVYRTFLLSIFITYMIRKDLPLKEIPILQKLFKK